MTDEPETLIRLFFEAIMKRSDSLDLLKTIAMDEAGIVRDLDDFGLETEEEFKEFLRITWERILLRLEEEPTLKDEVVRSGLKAILLSGLLEEGASYDAASDTWKFPDTWNAPDD